MQLKQLLSDDDAVSPVIGVILMVAITVILAAVIATFVLGLGEQVSTTAPQASFSFQFEEDSGNDYGTLTATHDGGDSIKATELYFRGNSGANSGDSDYNFNDLWSDVIAGSSGYGQTTDGTASGSIGSTSGVTGGDYAEIEQMGTDGQVRLIYEASQGDSSATISTWEGPDA
ncbi:type IV pilin N-terminal domain-containing protein [Halorientalis halophila]|uniref:type IV pilin N-terminal domain-containing protein n=1 Tax=Halorientalis halophila TaxID=3108499 RepID=UPI00300B92C9